MFAPSPCTDFGIGIFLQVLGESPKLLEYRGRNLLHIFRPFLYHIIDKEHRHPKFLGVDRSVLQILLFRKGAFQPPVLQLMHEIPSAERIGLKILSTTVVELPCRIHSVGNLGNIIVKRVHSSNVRLNKDRKIRLKFRRTTSP